jgi:hypothetical protein
MNRSADNLNKLRRACYRVSRGVCNVNSYVTKEEYEAMETLQRLTGLTYDTVNERFTEWSDTDNE